MKDIFTKKRIKRLDNKKNEIKMQDPVYYAMSMFIMVTLALVMYAIIFATFLNKFKQ